MSDSEFHLTVRYTAIALLRRWFGDQARWLVVLDDRDGRWQLIEAECLERESFREALDRELAWRLRLRRQKDYLISSGARLHVELPEVITRCSGEEEYSLDIFELYLVELFGAAGIATLDENPNVQWWAASQMFDASAPETGLSDRQQELLRMTDLVNDCTA